MIKQIIVSILEICYETFLLTLFIYQKFENYWKVTKRFRKLKKNLNSSGEKCSGISDGFFKILHLALGATG